MGKAQAITLKIHTLKKGWHDKDEILLHAAFQLLVDFIEKEHPERIGWNANKIHRDAWREIKSLYKWWKKTRPARRSPLDNKRLLKPPIKFKKIPGSELSQLVQPDRKKYAAYYRAMKKDGRLEKQWYEEDQRNLHRLIEVRGFLWT
ncbi:MAG: hypothetical protein A2W73_09440 [Deltaproteobacteria bacterium RIFCSPLOWO2_12_55_13]|nr:MAG: hypothetical protein A2W73_09440 [Deltaproteobacteria bacterium RIFCSPLOWO2_12_55_13]